MKKILITGANSYIGTSLENWLAQETDKYKVETINIRGNSWKENDFSIYDVVFHVAGIAHVSSDRRMEDLYYKVNRDLTIETAKKAKAEGVKQFIFMSSIIVYGDSSKNKRVIDSNTVPTPSNFYGKSKLQAEEGIKTLESDVFKVVVLRPPMIYGKRSKGNYPRLAKLAKKVPVFPDIDNERSMLHIDNLCEFNKIMIDHEESGLFFPQNKEYVKTSEMVRLIAEVNGKKIRLTKIFNGLLRLIEFKVAIVNKVFGNLVYEKSMSEYKVNYRIRDLRETIELTELESGQMIGNVQSKNVSEDLISIIMPAYNCGNFIGITLDSVINQTYQNWEVIMVDDCSTDDTAEVAQQYIKKDQRIKYHKLDKNCGAAVARNKAVDLAEGKYMAFLDSDDIWFPKKLTKQISFMEKNNYGFTCTSYTKIDEEGNYLNRTIKAQGKRDYEGVLKTCPGNSTVIYNAEKLGKYKIPDIKKRNDYVMWLQVIKNEQYLFGIEEPLGSHRIRIGAISSNKKSLVGYHWKVYREIEKLSLIKSSYLIVYWIVATVSKLR